MLFRMLPKPKNIQMFEIKGFRAMLFRILLNASIKFQSMHPVSFRAMFF